MTNDASLALNQFSPFFWTFYRSVSFMNILSLETPSGLDKVEPNFGSSSA